MPGTPIAKSASLFSANSFTCFGVMICSARTLRSSGRSGGTSSVERSPLIRSTGGRPTFKWRSEAFCWIIRCNTALKLKPVALAGDGMSTCAGTWVVLAIGVDPEEDLSVLDGVRIRHQHFAHHARVFRLDLVHDLHRLDDAEALPLLDASA